ncbi:DNA mismatch repair protein MutS [Amphibacillus xylanus]|uniref:DNA mismatch repair protein MutS n=1 Tax=Amphibacillus xylanus (strain ATCC 51415 / DSM 6626 / JCM 7361 / LMG 17667 / NBRC 15112 / Ep01) TaxID=698758 RepID=K0IYM2_AMPXN|nr:DNA mismatch repair protein MutS [Amphibacillus xylanus]BAM47559.1 DNA mismatch repair protein MutS [Amphibacillus xylanus NBRC 15112]
MTKYTPMIEQYLKIKAQHKDSFLFFRLGDFYELFFDDAVKAARELEITLTSRDGGGKERIPMCGVPHHSATNYIKNLVEKGYKVAICEQVEDPKEAKGVVKREVVQLITPGTVMDGVMLDEKENNYLASLANFDEDTYSIVYIDLSTGETSGALVTTGWAQVLNELYNRPVKEVIISPQLPELKRQSLIDRLNITISYGEQTELKASYDHLVERIDSKQIITGFSQLISYLEMTQKRALDHIKPLKVIELHQYLGLDMYSKRNLELTETIIKKTKKGSLLWVLDQTVTAMGARKLKSFLERPLLNQSAIEKRYQFVDGLMADYIQREELREHLKSIYDLERLCGRVAFGNVNARDLLQLKISLTKVPAIKEVLAKFSEIEIVNLSQALDPITDLKLLLEKSLADDPPLTIKEGNIIRDGFNEELDKYRDASRNGKQWIAELENQEKEATGIKSLKIGYNRIFGYYIEVTKANLHLLPEGKYERKQTLSNAERFITPELKEKENLILSAEEKSIELEYQLFLKLREQVLEYIPRLQKLADQISQLDVFQSFATISEQQGYCRPQLTTDGKVEIIKGRHPVVEKVMNDTTYVPNDVYLDQDNQILLITGPNMSGKSTYMRQVALIVIMAQIGCFVPADKAVLPIFDKIFTRIGASDDLVGGQSTFMVEMLEAKHALTYATKNSLILLDEIGRGTSTYDGMAIAQAIMEYVHDHIGAKTLFSTHYHELTSLSEQLTRLKNVHVRAEEFEGRVVFLHQIRKGPADKSYGIHVAKLAELPDVLIERANVILEQLEQNKQSEINTSQSDQLSFFVNEAVEQERPIEQSAVEKKLKSINIMELTPIEALNELYRLQQLLNKED